MDEMTEALLWGMLNWTAVGPDGLPAQILKIDHPAFAQYFHDILVNVRVAGEVPQHWKDAHHQGPSHKDRTDCNNYYRGSSLVAHAGKVLLNTVLSRLGNYRENEGINTPGETARLPPRTINDRYAVRRAPIARARTTEENPPVHVLHRSAEITTLSDRELLWEVLTGSGVPTKMHTIIRNFHEGVRARVRTGDGQHSEWFDVTQGLRQG